MPSALEGLLGKTVAFLEKRKMDYMVVGGFALPSYGAVRTTIDLDVAVRVEGTRAYEAFAESAGKAGFEPSVSSFANPVNVFRDASTGLEVEFWLRPDGIEWDGETLRRRERVRIGDVETWIVSPEDFIVSKLSRRDRGVQDEKDVKSVLARLGRDIDRGYLRRRASKAGVLGLLRAIQETR